MKQWLIFFILILPVAVNAKCGDYFCDSNEDCSSCPDDCLCTKGKHYELIECCNDFSCKECEKGYCEDRKCSTLEGFTSIFQNIECFNNGSIDMKINFQELDNNILTPGEDLKVYMKEKKDEATFKEISGTWTNPSREGDFKYTKISDTSFFTSDKDLFKLPGGHYIRVKYKMGRSNSVFEDTEISCPGIAIEPKQVPKAEEPEVEEVELKEITEPETEEKKEEVEEPQKKNNLTWYIITGIIILIIIIFFIKYEINVTKRKQKNLKN